MAQIKKLVLVVDDEPDVVRIVKTMVEAEGYEVLCAYDGLEVFPQLHERIPDLIIIDRIMPGMGGMEVIARLKESPKTSSIPIIMLTSMDKLDDVSEGYQKGADVYITKPFTKAQILNGIRLVLATRPALSEKDLKAHAVTFLRACSELSRRTEELVGWFAAQEGLSPSAWLYRWLELRIDTDQNQLGSLQKAPEWRYCFRGWGVDFENTKTGELVDLAIGPGGRADTFDEWRVQCYMENEAQRGVDFTDLNKIIQSRSDAVRMFMEYLSRQGWIEPARPKKAQEGKDLDAQLGDRWVISEKGARILQQA